MMKRESEWRVLFHKALANPIRLEIVDFLVDGEKCQCDILRVLDYSQSLISSYLSQLMRAGILVMRREGTRKMYRLNSEVADVLRQILRLAQRQTTDQETGV